MASSLAAILHLGEKGKEVSNSLRGLGAVLMQDGRPIAFASKSLTDTEKRYANIERKLLAVVYGCDCFRTYLYGKPFSVQSNHKPLDDPTKKSPADGLSHPPGPKLTAEISAVQPGKSWRAA